MLPALNLLADVDLLTVLRYVALIAMIALAVGIYFVIFQRRKEILGRVARRFLGRLDDRGLFELPQICLHLEGRPARLYYTAQGKNTACTHFEVLWPDSQLRCELHPQRGGVFLRRLLGMEDIEIGSPQFDQLFLITGNTREVTALLSADVQAIILRLARLHSTDGRDVHVVFQGGRLTVSKQRRLESAEHLERFILMSSELFQAALRTRATGITFVAGAELSELAIQQAQCQVCGESLVGDLIYCASARPPATAIAGAISAAARPMPAAAKNSSKACPGGGPRRVGFARFAHRINTTRLESRRNDRDG